MLFGFSLSVFNLLSGSFFAAAATPLANFAAFAAPTLCHRRLQKVLFRFAKISTSDGEVKYKIKNW
jgi:hypothetical protein